MNTNTHTAIEDQTADILGHRSGEWIEGMMSGFLNGNFIMKNQI